MFTIESLILENVSILSTSTQSYGNLLIGYINHPLTNQMGCVVLSNITYENNIGYAILFSEDFFNSLSHEERIFVAYHEEGHIVHKHHEQGPNQTLGHLLKHEFQADGYALKLTTLSKDEVLQLFTKLYEFILSNKAYTEEELKALYFERDSRMGLIKFYYFIKAIKNYFSVTAKA